MQTGTNHCDLLCPPFTPLALVFAITTLKTTTTKVRLEPKRCKRTNRYYIYSEDKGNTRNYIIKTYTLTHTQLTTNSGSTRRRRVRPFWAPSRTLLRAVKSPLEIEQHVCEAGTFEHIFARGLTLFAVFGKDRNSPQKG